MLEIEEVTVVIANYLALVGVISMALLIDRMHILVILKMELQILV